MTKPRSPWIGHYFNQLFYISAIHNLAGINLWVQAVNKPVYFCPAKLVKYTMTQYRGIEPRLCFVLS